MAAIAIPGLGNAIGSGTGTAKAKPKITRKITWKKNCIVNYELQIKTKRLQKCIRGFLYNSSVKDFISLCYYTETKLLCSNSTELNSLIFFSRKDFSELDGQNISRKFHEYSTEILNYTHKFKHFERSIRSHC